MDVPDLPGAEPELSSTEPVRVGFDALSRCDGNFYGLLCIFDCHGFSLREREFVCS